MAFYSSDITHCNNEQCPRKGSCLRYYLWEEKKRRIERGDSPFCWMFQINDADKCTNFINKTDYGLD